MAIFESSSGRWHGNFFSCNPKKYKYISLLSLKGQQIIKTQKAPHPLHSLLADKRTPKLSTRHIKINIQNSPRLYAALNHLIRNHAQSSRCRCLSRRALSNPVHHHHRPRCLGSLFPSPRHCKEFTDICPPK